MAAFRGRVLGPHSVPLRWPAAICVCSNRLACASALAQGNDLSLIHISEPTRLAFISYAGFC
eukprot:9447584-Alexandrium_andersonii.AAC.1